MHEGSKVNFFYIYHYTWDYYSKKTVLFAYTINIYVSEILPLMQLASFYIMENVVLSSIKLLIYVRMVAIFLA
jgi:hypothetical protein